MFVSRQPAAFEAGDPTTAQKAVQSKFQQAIIYGKTAIADPATKVLYAKKTSAGQSA